MTIGIERERYIIDCCTGKIVPQIDLLLSVARKIAMAEGVDPDRFTYELFAGQVEDKTPPCQTIDQLIVALAQNDRILLQAAAEVGVGFSHAEFVQECQIDSLEVNPYDERHRQIWQSLPPATRLAASSVAAIHVHVAVDEARVVEVLNLCRDNVVERLVALGDHSAGQRMASYRKMAGVSGTPPQFATLAHVLDYIDSHGGEKNVWDLVRYKLTTRTIEFRMFGTTPDIAEIVGYVDACLELVQ